MKGADVVMAGIVQYNDWLEEEVRAVYRGFLMQLLFSFQGSAWQSLSMWQSGHNC